MYLKLKTSALDSFNFAADTDPDPGSALEKIDPNSDPDNEHFFMI